MGYRAITAPLVNPARAGMIRRMSNYPIPAIRKPRASGDDPNKRYDNHILYA
mgnify:CR=1 FL=1